jgi:hypothetical protein
MIEIELRAPLAGTRACPYCKNPDLLLPAKKPRGRGELYSVAKTGRLWDVALNRHVNYIRGPWVYDFGDHARAFFPAERFAPRFRAFSVEDVGVKLKVLSVRRGERQAPPPKDPSRHYARFWDARVVAHPSGLVMSVHSWLTPEDEDGHGKLLRLTGQLLTGEAANDVIELAQSALDIFKRETRGAPKISQGRIMAAIRKQGARATQTATAADLGVSERAIRGWLRREGMTWPEIKGKTFSSQL